MKFVDEYRDPARAQAVALALKQRVTRPWTLMEICGGQTHSILRYGVDQLIPEIRTPRTWAGVPRVRHTHFTHRPGHLHRGQENAL